MPTMHYHLRQAVSFAVLIILSLIVLVSLLLFNIAPRYRSQASNPTPAVTVLTPLITNCNFTAVSCATSQSRISSTNIHLTSSAISAVNAIGASFDISPKVLVTLYFIQHYPTLPQTAIDLDQNQLMDTAKTLNTISHNYADATVPYVYDHPQLGFYRLTSFNQASYVLVRYAGDSSLSRQAFLNLVGPDNPKDGQVQGFVEWYYALFSASPTS